jgi:hypothetical protein
VLIVGDPPAEELEAKIGKLERALRREINYTVMNPKEFKLKRKLAETGRWPVLG